MQASRLISEVLFHFQFQIVNGVSQIAQYNNMKSATQFLWNPFHNERFLNWKLDHVPQKCYKSRGIYFSSVDLLFRLKPGQRPFT